MREEPTTKAPPWLDVQEKGTKRKENIQDKMRRKQQQSKQRTNEEGRVFGVGLQKKEEKKEKKEREESSRPKSWGVEQCWSEEEEKKKRGRWSASFERQKKAVQIDCVLE
jgi:hypothetical protein